MGDLTRPRDPQQPRVGWELEQHRAAGADDEARRRRVAGGRPGRSTGRASASPTSTAARSPERASPRTTSTGPKTCSTAVPSEPAHPNRQRERPPVRDDAGDADRDVDPPALGRNGRAEEERLAEEHVDLARVRVGDREPRHGIGLEETDDAPMPLPDPGEPDRLGGHRHALARGHRRDSDEQQTAEHPPEDSHRTGSSSAATGAGRAAAPRKGDFRPPALVACHSPAVVEAEGVSMTVIPGARPVGKQRSVGKCILLYIVTLGLYGLYWAYKTHEEIKRGSGEGVGGVLGLVIWIVIPAVSAFVIPSEIGKMYALRSRTSPVKGLTGLWLFPFGILLIPAFVWFVKVQERPQRVLEGRGGRVTCATLPGHLTTTARASCDAPGRPPTSRSSRRRSRRQRAR